MFFLVHNIVVSNVKSIKEMHLFALPFNLFFASRPSQMYMHDNDNEIIIFPFQEIRELQELQRTLYTFLHVITTHDLSPVFLSPKCKAYLDPVMQLLLYSSCNHKDILVRKVCVVFSISSAMGHYFSWINTFDKMYILNHTCYFHNLGMCTDFY